jgi:hypothetical protein
MRYLIPAQGEVAKGFEVLRQRDPICANADLAKVVDEFPHSCRVGAPARHERVAAGAAVGVLDVRTVKREPGGGQFVHRGCVSQAVVVSANVGPHIVNREEQHVVCPGGVVCGGT